MFGNWFGDWFGAWFKFTPEELTPTDVTEVVPILDEGGGGDKVVRRPWSPKNEEEEEILMICQAFLIVNN